MSWAQSPIYPLHKTWSPRLRLRSENDECGRQAGKPSAQKALRLAIPTLRVLPIMRFGRTELPPGAKPSRSPHGVKTPSLLSNARGAAPIPSRSRACTARRCFLGNGNRLRPSTWTSKSRLPGSSLKVVHPAENLDQSAADCVPGLGEADGDRDAAQARPKRSTCLGWRG